MNKTKIDPVQRDYGLTVLPEITIRAGGPATGEPAARTEGNHSPVLSATPLTRRHEPLLQGFQSAFTPLRQFLVKAAFSYEAAGNTCTTLFFNAEETLVAYCSTKCSALKIRGAKILSLCPAVEIAALCVDDRYRRQGIGRAVIRQVVRQIAALRGAVGVQLIILFAIPAAVPFYRKLGFRKLAAGMKVLSAPAHHGCTPMYLALPPVEVESR